MRKVHEKSIVLGIGIGMIITAIAGMIFSGGTPKELSKAEIISLAKGYGLIEQTKFLNEENSVSASTVAETTTAETTTAESTVADSTTASSTTAVASSSNSAERDIVIEVKYGYKSQHVIDELLEKGVIENKEDFIAVLDLYNASTKINTGTFRFKKNEDFHYIVKTICKLK